MVAGILLELNNAVNYNPVTREHFIYFIFGKMFEHLLITSIGPLIGGIVAGLFYCILPAGETKIKPINEIAYSFTILYFFLSIFILLVENGWH
jgi:hypothetical protein